MKSHFSLALGLSISGLTFPIAQAADGTWTNTATGGLWSDSANWSSTTIADGSGSTANFSTIDLTADNTVQLDSARTIGNLTFGDTATATAGSWTLANNGNAANILTLGVASGSPVITVNTLGTNKLATITAELSGSQGFTKAGAGELALSGTNTYSGSTIVNAGTLRLIGAAGTGGTILNSTGITVAAGATFAITNDLTNGNSTNRIADTASITLSGGTFTFNPSTAGSTVFSETVGQLNISSGANRITGTSATGSGSSSTLTFASLNRTPGATVNFANATGAASNKILFTTAPTLDAGNLIGGYALAGSADFATYGANGIAIATSSGGAETGWTTTQNVKFTLAAAGATTLTGNRDINSLSYAQSGSSTSTSLNLGGFALRVRSGGVLVSGGTSSATILNGSLTAGYADDTAGELVLMSSQASSRFLTVSANIVDNGSGVVSVVLNGNANGNGGQVALSGINTYTGTTTIAGNAALGSSTAINNSRALTIAAGATMQLGGFTATVDGLSGSGAFSTNNASGSGTFNSALSLGNNNGSATFNGTFNVSSSTRDLDIIKNGTGTQIMAGTDNRDINTTTSVSTTTINGGTYQAAKQVSLYNNVSARWNATNLIINNGGTLALNVGGTGEFTSANVDTIKALGTATGGFQSGSKLGLDTTNATGGNFTYASAIANTNSGANSVGLTKLGTGTLTLTANSTYTGATIVSAGTLLVNGSLGASAVTANGGTFGGTGTVGSNVTINAATYAAGASAGSLEIAGDLGLSASSSTAIELGGVAFTLNGTEEYDRTKLTGATSALNLGGGTLGVSLISGFTLTAGQAFGIFQLENTATRTGTFAGLGSDGSLVGTFGGVNLFITYSGNFSDTGTIDLSGGNDIVLYTVPEPAAAGIGAIGLLLILRRRRMK
ncbi:beta strand repeat-containing protein [Luteolibacter soli]|uniref:Autotransporter-associated beta strand repeat-containing protein n=1 Tax=Luteolibacter soli TaxID=3135280 RepID=A0ABU9AVC4_9BACT